MEVDMRCKKLHQRSRQNAYEVYECARQKGLNDWNQHKNIAWGRVGYIQYRYTFDAFQLFETRDIGILYTPHQLPSKGDTFS